MDDLTLRYRGYEGSVEVSLDDGVLHGRVLFVNDLVSYEGATVPELEVSFREAVDAYLELCTDKGTEPDRPFKGAFNVRVSPTLHREIALRAAREGRSLNEVVKAALASYLDPTQYAPMLDGDRRPAPEHSTEAGG